MGCNMHSTMRSSVYTHAAGVHGTGVQGHAPRSALWNLHAPSTAVMHISRTKQQQEHQGAQQATEAGLDAAAA